MHGEEDKHIVKPSSDFYVKDKEDEAPIYYKMIDTIDDIMAILKYKESEKKNKDKDEKTKKETMYLIHRNDDLQKLLFDLIAIGYTPGILYETGRIAKLIIEYNKTTFIIKCQQLTTKSIERPIHVESELVYNNMSGAMTKFNKRMFKLNHKSYYTKQDVDILDEYRTIANSGMLAKKT